MGDPIRVEIRRSLGSHLAGASIPRRLILLDAAVLARRGEFERILIHELFHFVWVRLSNQKRRAWEQVLAGELRERVKGELGWSAEWRKELLTRADRPPPHAQMAPLRLRKFLRLRRLDVCRTARAR